jgi:hypothetical protein
MRIPDIALAAFTMASMCSVMHCATRHPKRRDERLNRSAPEEGQDSMSASAAAAMANSASTRTRSIRKQQPVTVTESPLEPFSIRDALDIAQTVIDLGLAMSSNPGKDRQ